MADKNITQVDGGEITDPALGIIYIGTPSAGPYGYDDAFITTENFKLSLQTQITSNDSDITTLQARATALEAINTVTYHKNKNSSFNFTLAAYEHVFKVVLIWRASSPKVKIGTTLAGDDIMPEVTLSNSAGSRYIVFTLSYGDSVSDTLYVSVTGGTISMARYMTQVDSSLI